MKNPKNGLLRLATLAALLFSASSTNATAADPPRIPHDQLRPGLVGRIYKVERLEVIKVFDSGLIVYPKLAWLDVHIEGLTYKIIPDTTVDEFFDIQQRARRAQQREDREHRQENVQNASVAQGYADAGMSPQDAVASVVWQRGGRTHVMDSVQVGDAWERADGNPFVLTGDIPDGISEGQSLDPGVYEVIDTLTLTDEDGNSVTLPLLRQLTTEEVEEDFPSEEEDTPQARQLRQQSRLQMARALQERAPSSAAAYAQEVIDIDPDSELAEEARLILSELSDSDE